MSTGPQVSPPPGSYPLTVFVSITKGVSSNMVRYTTDAADPTESSPEYTAPIQIAETSTLKVTEYDPKGSPPKLGKPSTFTYLIGQQLAPWSRGDLAKTLIGFALLTLISFAIYGCYTSSNNAPLLGHSSAEIQMALSGIYCALGLVLLALMAFFIGETRFVVFCLIAEIAGSGAGWIFGIYFSPSGPNESHSFQQAGLAVGTLLSGVVLSKVLRVVDTFLDPSKDTDYVSVLILSSYFVAASIFVSITVYVDRAYGPQFMISAAPVAPLVADAGPSALELIDSENGVCAVFTGGLAPPSTPTTLMQLIRSTNTQRPALMHWSLVPSGPDVFIDGSTGAISSKLVPKRIPDTKEPVVPLYVGHALGVDQGTSAYATLNVWIGSILFKSNDSLAVREDACKKAIHEALTPLAGGQSTSEKANAQKPIDKSVSHSDAPAKPLKPPPGGVPGAPKQ